MANGRLWGIPAGLAFVVAVPAVVAALFRSLLGAPWLGPGSYLYWVLDYGGAFCLSVGLLSVVVGDLDRNTGLVSRHPSRFLGGISLIIGALMISMGRSLQTAGDNESVDVLDGVLSLPLLLAALFGTILGALLFGPPLFYVTLVAGAPSRIWLREPSELVLPDESQEADRAGSAEIDDIALGRHPVGLSLLLAAFLFWCLRQLVP